MILRKVAMEESGTLLCPGKRFLVEALGENGQKKNF
jgi:hypothetical protein